RCGSSFLMPSESRTVSIRSDLLRCCRRSRCGVLQIVIRDERFSDVDIVGGEQNPFNLAAVDQQRDAARLGIRIKGLANVVLERRKNFTATLLVIRLRVLALALIIFLHLIDLFELGLNSFWIDRRG